MDSWWKSLAGRWSCGATPRIPGSSAYRSARAQPKMRPGVPRWWRVQVSSAPVRTASSPFGPDWTTLPSATAMKRSRTCAGWPRASVSRSARPWPPHGAPSRPQRRFLHQAAASAAPRTCTEACAPGRAQGGQGPPRAAPTRRHLLVRLFGLISLAVKSARLRGEPGLPPPQQAVPPGPAPGFAAGRCRPTRDEGLRRVRPPSGTSPWSQDPARRGRRDLPPPARRPTALAGASRGGAAWRRRWAVLTSPGRGRVVGGSALPAHRAGVQPSMGRAGQAWPVGCEQVDPLTWISR